MAFRCSQTSGFTFRAQLHKRGDKSVLWVAESDEELYLVTFDKALIADVYQPQGSDPSTQVLLLTEDAGEVETVNVGSFTMEDAKRFISWFHAAVSSD